MRLLKIMRVQQCNEQEFMSEIRVRIKKFRTSERNAVQKHDVLNIYGQGTKQISVPLLKHNTFDERSVDEILACFCRSSLTNILITIKWRKYETIL